MDHIINKKIRDKKDPAIDVLTESKVFGEG